MSDLRRGYRYQVSTYALKSVWFVLDTHSPTEFEGQYQLPIVATALSRAAARNIARIRNHPKVDK